MHSRILIGIIALTQTLALSTVTFAGNCEGGDRTGTKVRTKFKRIHQNKYNDFATDLHFKVWQKEDNIDVEGWNIAVSCFPSVQCQRGSQPGDFHTQLDNIGGVAPTTDPDNGQHALDVNADGAQIPHCTFCEISATLWLTDWNTVRIQGINWTKGSTQPQKAAPDFGWTYGFPVEDPLAPGIFIHELTLTNDDPTQPYWVTGLDMIADVYYDDLDSVPFPGTPLPDVLLAPGESYTTEVRTEGDWVCSDIYAQLKLQADNAGVPDEVLMEIALDHHVTPEPATLLLIVAGSALLRRR